MTKGPKNKKQFDILKVFTDWPKADMTKIAEAFKVDYIEVTLVSLSYNFEKYQELKKDSNSLDDLIGGSKLFG